MKRTVYLTQESFHLQNQELNHLLPYQEDLSVLKETFALGHKTAPNRLVCQAMEGCDGTPGGSPDTLTKRRYDRFAKGGAGIIWFEATAVMKEGRANPRQLYIHEGNLDDFKKQVAHIKETGLRENGSEPIIIMQATHSGRYSKPNGTPAPLIAYHHPLFEKDAPIAEDRIVSDDYLDQVKEALIHGAELAEKAGFDGVDIKCCHRYLNSELLSAFERPGRYGGSLENRTRLLRESILGAQERCSSDFIVSSRLNIYDGFEYPTGFGVAPGKGLAFDPTEPGWLIRELADYGVPLLNITMGNPYFNPHVNRPFAMGGYIAKEHPLEGVARMLEGIAKMKEYAPHMALISSGLSYLGVAAPHVAAAYINKGGFDFAGFGRTIFAYPDFAKDILAGEGMKREKCCICCSKCTEIMRTPGGTPGCVIHDKDPYLEIYKKCKENGHV